MKCLVEDDIWIYAGCDDGNVYDLSGKLVRLAYELDKDVDVLWLDVWDGMLAASDANGSVTEIDPEGEVLWSRLSQGKLGWMVRCDDRAIYHGHAAGVTAYDRDRGMHLWHRPTEGSVLFGWQEGEALYVGTSGKALHRIDKAAGVLHSTYACDASAYSCATAPGGEYVFAGDNSAAIYCFDRGGKRLWKLQTGCGSALSMQYLGDRLYIVTTEGTLACIDATPAAIQAAQIGQLPQAVTRQAPAPLPLPTPSLQETMASTARESDRGVIVECFHHEGKLRVRAISPGYDPDWMVQFPRDIRQAGARYRVAELREARQGGYYRTFGDIQRLE